jgi:Ca2+-binding RTX toxin-like protein
MRRLLPAVLTVLAALVSGPSAGASDAEPASIPAAPIGPPAASTPSDVTPEVARAVAGRPSLGAARTALAVSPDPVSTIPGLDGGAAVAPPHTQGAVGTDHLIEVVADGVRISSKDGTVVAGSALLDWWRGFDPSIAQVVDPTVVWEPVGKRFVMAASVDPGVPEAGVVLAVSRTSDPTGPWWMVRVDADVTGGRRVDSTRVGFSADRISVAVDRRETGTGDPLGSLLLGFDRADAEDDDASMAFARVIDRDRTGLVPVTTMDAFVGPQLIVSDDGNGRSLTVGVLSGAGTRPTYTGRAAAVSGARWSTTPVDAPQLGSPVAIDTGDPRLQTCTLRNGTVWCAHTVFLPASAPTRAAVQWWQFLPEGTVLQQARLGVPSAYPSLAVGPAGDLLLGSTRFATDAYASGAYRLRGVADPVGTLGSEIVFAPGEAPYVAPDGDGVNRWGDTSATVVDPSDGSLWTLQTSAASPDAGGDRWRTTWARVVPPAAAGADVAAAVTRAPARALRGHRIEMDLAAVANGPSGPAGVVVSLETSDGARVVSAPGLCDPSPGRIDCPLGPLDRGEVARLAIAVALRRTGPVTLEASVSSPDDPDPSDDVATVTIEGLDATTCTHTGTGGNDQLVGTGLTDVLCAGGGDDVVYPSGGEDLVVAGPGYDYVAYSNLDRAVEIDLGANRVSVGRQRSDLRGVEGAFGSPQDDVVTGDRGDNVLTGLGGDDRIDGGSGRDTVSYYSCVGDGCARKRVQVDLARGRAWGPAVGTDTLRRIDHVYGTLLGDDRITGDAGPNFLYGFGGADVLTGRSGDDFLSGGDGADRLVGGPGDDVLSGGAGVDACRGGGGATTKDTCL